MKHTQTEGIKKAIALASVKAKKGMVALRVFKISYTRKDFTRVENTVCEYVRVTGVDRAGYIKTFTQRDSCAKLPALNNGVFHIIENLEKGEKIFNALKYESFDSVESARESALKVLSA